MRFELQDHMRARYEMLGLLGEGGMNVVYKARDTQLDRLVALKFLATPGLESAPACDRALAEARAIAALNYPNIATIYEVGESDAAPVLVFEYLPGGTLRSRTSARPLSLSEIVEFWTPDRRWISTRPSQRRCAWRRQERERHVHGRWPTRNHRFRFGAAA